jgi:hypothetical protein
LKVSFYTAVGVDHSLCAALTNLSAGGMMAGVKFSSIRLLVICLLTWLGTKAAKAVYSFEDKQR